MTSYSRVQLQPAYVLHQRPYRDTSAIVEIFSEAYGRRSLVAKGLKRPKSKLKGLLQPFQPLLISWVGKSELGTLTDAELYSTPVAMKSRYLSSAFYLNELLLRLLHKDDPHSDVFIAYHNTLENLQQLSGLESDELRWQAILRQFEVMLLQSLGYGLVLDHDVVSQLPIKQEMEYEYVIDHGPVLVDSMHVSQGGATVSGQTLGMLADDARMMGYLQHDNDDTRQLFAEAKRLLRAVIDSHLGSKSLHSRDLFINTAARQRATSSESTELVNEQPAQEAG